MKFSFCCTELRPSSEAVNTWDAVDAAAMDQKTDFFSFMIYSSGTTYYDYLKYAADHLKHARAFPWIDPAEEHERFFVRYSPEKIRQNMIATIALNAMGIMFYPIDTMDGRNLTMINGTAAVIAELEDIYEGRNLSKQVQWQIRNAEIINVFDDKGKYSKVEYPDLSSRIKVHLHEKNGRYVLSILNYASETGLLQIAIPDFAGSPSVKVADMIRKKSYSGITADQIRNGFVVEVPAGDSSIFRISEENAPYPEITQAELQEKLKMFQQGQERNNPLDRSRQNGSRAVQWRIFKKKPMPTLINGEHYITINPGENARIEEWSSGRFTPIGQPKGSLGELNFLDPSQASSHEYAVVDFSLNGTLPYLTFRSSVLPDTSAVGNANPLTGLIMEKRIALDDSGSITMTDTFRNPTENTMRFAFRIKNIPYSVWKAGSNPVVMLKEQEAIPGTYLKKGCRINWYAANQITYFQGEPSVSLITGNRQIRLIFPHAAGVFFWKNQTLHTVEPLYEELILKSGESKSFTQKISAVYKDGKQ